MTDLPIVRIATRESPLAMWQARFVAQKLTDAGYDTRLVPLVSGGDVDQRPIDGSRSVGLFTKRIQQALIDDEADVAVHSLKDLPTEPDERFTLAAVPTRETVSDSLVSPQRYDVDTLPKASVVGTGSRRRMAQLKALRNDLDIRPIRGNVQTRLSKLNSGEFDAILLAEAGIRRLEMNDLPRQTIELSQMLPAPGQGALGIEVRAGDTATLDAVSKLDDPNSRLCVTAERTILSQLHGGCLAPIAVLATIVDDRVNVHARVLSHDGRQCLNETGELDSPDAESTIQLATNIANRLIESGAREMIEQERSSNL
ncbi:hydroxymethylbilane synthase [Crateriforma conspicua]|uniref:Porphobilinogen deaminase n=1 Tax=Crateriforma conspicua TaxID=2527996 RepID=A0A5C6FSG2_9PLAN|nr:hydroxymethylbilane synthase [Crateriforma conspicua]TWU66102.1 Porphobilinogen deaminase [Crateriforma conspicua]